MLDNTKMTAELIFPEEGTDRRRRDSEVGARGRHVDQAFRLSILHHRMLMTLS